MCCAKARNILSNLSFETQCVEVKADSPLYICSYDP